MANLFKKENKKKFEPHTIKTRMEMRGGGSEYGTYIIDSEKSFYNSIKQIAERHGKITIEFKNYGIIDVCGPDTELLLKVDEQADRLSTLLRGVLLKEIPDFSEGYVVLTKGDVFQGFFLEAERANFKKKKLLSQGISEIDITIKKIIINDLR